MIAHHPNTAIYPELRLIPATIEIPIAISTQHQSVMISSDVASE